MSEQKSDLKSNQPVLWDQFLEWFKAEHPGDWSRRNQMPEWKAFQAGAIAALLVEADYSKRSER
ncbi:MAG TPA: hypothetical protein VMQ76_03810 [Terracidiphilus sp.]|jgi:hypothetical protein|nr:hypothetical protein [Terracidiphilus sp.]